MAGRQVNITLFKTDFFKTNLFKKIDSFRISRHKVFKTRWFKLLLAAAVLAFSLLLIVETALAGTTFTVNSTGDTADLTPGDGICAAATGECTLRAAIQEANATSNGSGPFTSPDTIDFNIPGAGVQTISPASALPTITDPVIIDGYSQPGTSQNTLAQGDNATLLIELNGASAGGAFGLNINASASTVKGLVINRFQGGGIQTQSLSSGAQLQGNFIGTNTTGTFPLPNANFGVITFGANSTVGGTTPGARNIISGNMSNNLYLSSNNNQVQGNFLGTDRSGTNPLPNRPFVRYGVRIDGANNTIGGMQAGAGNTISDNFGPGVMVYPGGTVTGNAILTNSIFSNGGLGIDLGADGVNFNDYQDSDTGPNNLQNYPVLTSATNSGGTTTIEGTLNSNPNTTFTVQFFSNATADPSGYGEGQTYLGQQDVTTDGGGNATLSFPTTQVSVGQYVGATATNKSTNDTSEFSKDIVVNTPPVANDQSITAEEDTAKTITLTGTDTDGNGLTFQITSGPTNGTIGSVDTPRCMGTAPKTCSADVTYTPKKDFNGTDSFKFRVNDGTANSGEASISLNVTAVNDSPSFDLGGNQTVDEDAGAQTVSGFATNISAGPADEASSQTVSFNVTNDNNSLFSEQPAISSDGTLTYKPAPDASGSATVTVKARDSQGAESASKTFTLTVRPVNDAPVASDDAKSTPENTPLVFPASDLVANDSEGPENEDNQTLTVTEVKNPIKGAVELRGGQITFTPQTDYNGSASFEYTVCDNGQTNGQSDPQCSTLTATVNVTVSPVNSRPTATDGSEEIDEDAQPITIDLSELVSDTETSDANLTYTVVDAPNSEAGTLSGSGPTFTFDPADNFNGQVSITYEVTDRGDPDNCGPANSSCDAAETSEVKTVTIEVRAVNDPPVVRDDSYQTDEDNELTVPADRGVLANDEDLDSQNPSVELVQGPKEGELELNADGSFIYKPFRNTNGSDTFTYKVKGAPSGADDTATVTIDVKAVDDPPSARTRKCTIKGTKHSETLRGTPGPDVICGVDGNDKIEGLGGDDVIYGGSGKDVISGGAGNDEIYGLGGKDTLNAGDGESGNDLADGGNGRDTCKADRGDRKIDCP